MATIKTIKLKRNPQSTMGSGPASESTPVEATGAAPAAETAPQPAAVAAPVPIPVAGPKVSGKSYMPYVVAASLVAIIFLVILGLQYSEISYFAESPSVWVNK